MINVNWDLAPEGAVAIKQDSWGNLYWVNKQDKYWGKSEWSRLLHHSSWKTIATRPKPTITKAQAWDMLCKKEHEFDIVNKIKSEYDITDETEQLRKGQKND